MKVILKARVRRVTGKTRHAIGKMAEGRPIPISPLPAPDWVGIARDQSGFFLLHFNDQGAYFNDTWHEALKGAKSQARFEFEISEGDWQVPTSTSTFDTRLQINKRGRSSILE
jgi:hypothetical protein